MDKNGKCVCGKEATIADFQIFAEMLDMVILGKDYKKYSKVAGWHDTCMQTEGIK